MKYPIELACIIDDDDMYVNLITKVIDLRKLSKNLLIFRNGKEALDYFVSALKNMERRDIPEVILLDLNMPVMDGWQFLNELSKYDFKELNETTLYIVSSSINPADIERSKAISMVKDFLVKPIRPNEIANVFLTDKAS
jgi:CheY-like chemotaxis protein